MDGIDQLVSNMLGELRVSQSDVGDLVYSWIRRAYEHLDSLTFWQDLEVWPPHQFALVAPYEDGTVTVTNGNVQVVGSGTNWTDAMEGQLIQPADDSTWYVIEEVTGADTLNLAAPYIGTTAAGATYAIHTVSYALPERMSRTKIRSLVLQDPYRKLGRLSESEADELVPNILRSTGAPHRYTDWGSGQIQLIPPPDQRYLCVLRYQRLPAAPEAGGEIDWPEHMHECVQMLATSFGWDYLEDDKAGKLRRDALALAAQHVETSGVKSDYRPKLQRFDDTGRSEGYTYPRRINFSGGLT